MELLWLVPTIPVIGFLILTFSCGKLPQVPAAIIGAGSIGLSFLVAVLAGMDFMAMSEAGTTSFSQTLWTWMEVGSFKAGFTLYLDGVSLVMMFIITGIGFLIHVYATGYMNDDPSFARFFAYMNLFVAAMLILVLADNLLLLFMGWEGVGLCSYLLIGFWFKDPYNGYCARKAFVVTRVGDASMALGLFLLFASLGTLNIQELMVLAEEQWVVGSGIAIAVTLLLLGGAVGKSAQLPLQTWLPDAMAGPTPISALIHAATMVTAGVYLIARTHVLYELAPSVQYLVGVIGMITLLMAGFTALVQNDIKKVLAFSTVSQIGYMFLALGVGAYSSAIFHLMTHAFFKALLFLTAGSIILAMHHEQDIFKMGGLRKDLPWSHALFLIGTIALVAIFPTSGFFSKEEILASALTNEHGGYLLWLGGVAGAFMTGLYSFRLYFLVFFGKKTHDGHEVMGWHLQGPLVVLAVLALVGGFIHIPVEEVFQAHAEEHHISLFYQAIMIGLPLFGALCAYLIFVKKKINVEKFAGSGVGAKLHRFFYTQWGMDWLYDRVIVFPYVGLAKLNKKDFVDSIYNGTASLVRHIHNRVTETQTGQIRWYTMTMALGVLLVISIGVFA
ncbi:NADH-quinone oxidoreductase subunit L [Haliea sp. AH-315-K21]|uniref:NADH-quinone oxidoreductase subunit L n=1 Tax=SAR86 cluster bacterium TaxID=2030880 RepID=A0A2A5C732_9GAMM|nr:NADH-quinone oxidoreductase subunit L [Haliea sp. AH-315-K21]PCJ39679.1 MAG: NADH-quinone oxidoreductase subunit L [SAR86 cluster bacterium]